MTGRGFPVSVVRSELPSTLTPKVANPLNAVYYSQFAVRRRARHCLSSRPWPWASLPCQSRSTMARIFPVNIKPALMLLPGLLPSLSRTCPLPRWELSLALSQENPAKGKTLQFTQAPPWLFLGRPRGPRYTSQR